MASSRQAPSTPLRSTLAPLVDEGAFGSLSYILHFLPVFELSLLSFECFFLRPYASVAWTLRERASLAEIVEMTIRWNSHKRLCQTRRCFDLLETAIRSCVCIPTPLHLPVRDNLDRHSAFVCFVASTFQFRRTILFYQRSQYGTRMVEVFHPPDWESSHFLELSFVLGYRLTARLYDLSGRRERHIARWEGSIKELPLSAFNCMSYSCRRNRDRCNLALALASLNREEEEGEGEYDVGDRTRILGVVVRRMRSNDATGYIAPAQVRMCFRLQVDFSSSDLIANILETRPSYFEAVLRAHPNILLDAIERTDTFLETLINQLMPSIVVTYALCAKTYPKSRNSRFVHRREKLTSRFLLRSFPSLIDLCYCAMMREMSLFSQHPNFEQVLTNCIVLSLPYSSSRNAVRQQKLRALLELWSSILVPFGEDGELSSVIECIDDRLEFVVIESVRDTYGGGKRGKRCQYLLFTPAPQDDQDWIVEDWDPNPIRRHLTRGVPFESCLLRSRRAVLTFGLGSRVIDSLSIRMEVGSGTDVRRRWISTLHLACWEGDIPKTEKLLRMGANVNVCASGPGRIRPITLAVWRKRWEIVGLLVGKEECRALETS